MSSRLRCVSFIVAAMSAACGGSGSPSSPQVRIPNYAGNWSGTYTITGCTQSGQAASTNICAILGTTPPYSFSLTQSDRDVAGSFTLGAVGFPAPGGVIAQDGSLQLSGTTVSFGITLVVDWALNMPAQAITGTTTQQWTSTGPTGALTGAASITGTINSATRSASAAGAVSANTIRQLADLAAAMSGR
jgi:hypothetical protein